MIQPARAVFLLLAAACVSGCGRDAAPRADDSRAAAGADSAPSREGDPVILFVGTSLTAGLGIDPESAFPAVLQRRLDRAGLRWNVVSGGVSGETSAGLLRRLPWHLESPIRVMIIETGANDGLRGLPVEATRANIDSIITLTRARYPNIRIVLTGMEAPPSMGPRFTAAFREMYPALARRHHLPLVPFLLEGVGGVDTLNQGDGIHPTAAGHRLVAENVWRVLEPALRNR